MAQGAALAAGFALLVLLAGWGIAGALRGHGSWKLVAPGVVAAVGAAGYAVLALRELASPQYEHDTFLYVFAAGSAVAAVLGGLLVFLAYPRGDRVR